MVSPTVQPSTKRNTSLNSPAKWRTVLLVWCLSHFQLLMDFFAGVIVIVTFSVTLPTTGEPQQTYHTTNVQTTAAAGTVAAVTTAAVATTAATKDLLPRVGSETTSNPRLYLHVGPGKMATTTIQDALHANKETFSADNFCVIDSRAFQKVAEQLNIHGFESMTLPNGIRGADKEITSLKVNYLKTKKELTGCQDRNLSVVLSSEYLGLVSREQYDRSLAPLLKGFTLTIVVGYRRFYSWAPSVYFQLKRHSSKGYVTWDDKFATNFKSYFKNNDNLYKLYTDSYINNWSHIVDRDNIKIYNMHEDNNVVKTFYCSVVKAEHACKEAIENPPPESNVGFSTVFDAIAVAAHKKGIVPGNFTRKGATLVTSNFFSDKLITQSDLPKDCFEEEDMARIMEKSKVVESMLLPTYFASERGEATMQTELDKLMESKYCMVDTERVIADYEIPLHTEFRNHKEKK